MTLANTAPPRLFRGKLARTMLWVLLPLSLVPLIIMGSTAYLRARQLLTDQSENTLLLLEKNHKEQIEDWLLIRDRQLTNTSGSFPFVSATRGVLNEPDRASSTFISARARILTELNRVNHNGILFHQFLIVSPEGIVVAASKQTLEGQSLAETAYFSQLSEEQPYLAVYEPALLDYTLAFITTQPIYSETGNVLASVWGVSDYTLFDDLFTSNNIINARSYMLNADGLFLGVGSNSLRNPTTLKLQPSSDQERLFTLEEDTRTDIIKFFSFDSTEVIATYFIIPALNIGLATELSSALIQEQVNALVPFYIGLLVVTMLLTGMLITWGSQQIVQPLTDITQTAQHFSDGDWNKRAEVNRNDEIGLLSYTFNQMANELTTLYRAMETKVEARTEQLRTATEVARLATSATSLDALLKQTTQLIVEHFNYYHVAIYLLDDTKRTAFLREAYGTSGPGMLEKNFKLPVDAHSMVGWVATNNLPRVVADVNRDPFYLALKSLPATQSEVSIPLSVRDNVLGVLDVQSEIPNAFDPESVATLQTLASQITSALQNIRLLEATRTNLQATSALYQASHRISEASTADEVLSALSITLQDIPLISALFKVGPDVLEGISAYDPASGKMPNNKLPKIAIPSREIAELFPGTLPIIVTGGEPTDHLPKQLIQMPQQMGCQAFALYPIKRENEVAALLVLGTGDEQELEPAVLEPYNSLVEITKTTLEKVAALQAVQEHLIELQTLSTVSRSISAETEISALYQIIHQQILQVMGDDIRFFIARYDPQQDTIEVPYMDEGGGQISSIAPFPLGQGITSIVIRTRQPLMIVEDTTNRVESLGAITTGTGTAKSWLGVPLLVAGEPIGAIVVQDLENEHRFDESDMSLLTTLASQVAIALRNARLLETAQLSAYREQQLYDVTTKIRRSADLQSILQTTVQEIGKIPGIRGARIQLSVPPPETAADHEEI